MKVAFSVGSASTSPMVISPPTESAVSSLTFGTAASASVGASFSAVTFTVATPSALPSGGVPLSKIWKLIVRDALGVSLALAYFTVRSTSR